MSASCKAQVKEYCQNCSFAGIRFIADDSKHWIERWFWVVLVILSWYGSALLIIAAWNAFVNNPISFGVETTYTDWSTKMPAVAVCEMANDDQIYNVSDAIWTPKHLLDLEDALKDIAYFRGVAYSLIDVCYLSKNPDHLCPLSNYSYYTNLVRSPCPKLIRNCSYNNVVFTCCDYFQPIKTDLGTCYIINSIQTENPKPYPMITNITQKRGILRFQIMLLSMIYTIGEDEIPGITTLYSSTLKASLGNTYLRQVSVRDIENDPLVVETTLEQRACRFNSETQGLYPHYSYSACIVLCRKRAQLDICHCNDHFMLNTCKRFGNVSTRTSGAPVNKVQKYWITVLAQSVSERCNITGMWCLHTHSKQLTALKPPWSQRQGLICDCLPSCEETDITIIKDVTTPLHPKRKKAFVEVMLPYLPTERFKRNVVRSRLDLVVSVGSTAGLFVGASLLSFVELIFFFTVRYISNVLMERRKRKRVRIILHRE